MNALLGERLTDAELIDVAREWRVGIVGNGSSAWKCAMVCWPLAGYLESMHGIKCECVESDLGECNHVWIRLPDGRALDPTGDQFNWCMKVPVPDIYLGPPLTDTIHAPPPNNQVERTCEAGSASNA